VPSFLFTNLIFGCIIHGNLEGGLGLRERGTYVAAVRACCGIIHNGYSKLGKEMLD
jgi:hypothetical protein